MLLALLAMTSWFSPATPIVAPSQRVFFELHDEITNPSTGPNVNLYLWPPSFHCDDDVGSGAGVNWLEVSVPKSTTAATQVDIKLFGSFLFNFAGENQSPNPLLYTICWPSFWFDIYIQDTPAVLGVDTYDARSTLYGPDIVALFLAANDGIMDFGGPGGATWPLGWGPRTLVLPQGGCVVTITNPTLLALFNGASGNAKVCIKPRATAPQVQINGGAWGPVGSGGVASATKERFL